MLLSSHRVNEGSVKTMYSDRWQKGLKNYKYSAAYEREHTHNIRVLSYLCSLVV